MGYPGEQLDAPESVFEIKTYAQNLLTILGKTEYLQTAISLWLTNDTETLGSREQHELTRNAWD